jgi:hypothetical protein
MITARTVLQFGASSPAVIFRSKSISCALLLALSVLLTATANAQQPQTTPQASKHAKASSKTMPAVKQELEPKAIEILKAACARLAAAHTMQFTAIVMYESPSRIGPPLAYTTKSEVTLQRPDKLKVVTVADGPPSEFYYNGKTMMAYAPTEDLVAIAPAPPTIDATLEKAYRSAAIYFPFSDVVVADPYKDLSEGLRIAFYIGQSHVIAGITTDMVAYANDNVFVQVWIGADDKLPRMLRAVYRDDPLRLRNHLELTDWKIDPVIASDAFTSSKAEAGKRIAFASPDAWNKQGLRPPRKAEPPKKP